MKKSLIAAVLLAGLAGPAAAVGNLADISVYDRAENRTLPVYFHEGRYYVAGKPGNEYQVNIRNTQPGEILSVIAVDGVNAVSGETANWSQTGYVLSPYTSFGVKGGVRICSGPPRSFSPNSKTRTRRAPARPDHVGVIGVAVFRKRAEPPVSINRFNERRRQGAADDAPAAEMQNSAKDEVGQAGRVESDAARSAPAPATEPRKLGTGHGQSETSVVRYTNFERASSRSR